MLIRNYLDTPAIEKTIHDGEGLIKSRKLFGAEDFATNLRYVAQTELPPGASIGFHAHADAREEVYVIQYGTGRVRIDDQERPVRTGDVIVTHVGESHGLFNDSAAPLGVFVFWVAKQAEPSCG
ncbi:MAG: mannose-6-phosphate isomerase [Proteobacteria bacterium]|nr:mannose-6-phosphate isomerase [Pseudomonadota bacterium]